MHLREESTRCDRADDCGREPPVELLGDLEGDRLRALRVVRTKPDVDERPVELEGELDAHARAVVIASVDRVDRRSVDRGRGQLLRLEVGRAENGGLDSLRCCARCDCVREVACRGARERRRAEFERLRAGDGDDAVLERMSRIGGVELQVQLAEAERAREPWGREERREPGCESRLGRCGHREELCVAPDRGRPSCDRVAREGLSHDIPVVDRIERPVAGRAHTHRLERMLALADPTPKRLSWHDDLPFLARHIRPGLAPCFITSRLPRRHRAGPSASLDAERGEPRCRRAVYKVK